MLKLVKKYQICLIDLRYYRKVDANRLNLMETFNDFDTLEEAEEYMMNDPVWLEFSHINEKYTIIPVYVYIEVDPVPLKDADLTKIDTEKLLFQNNGNRITYPNGESLTQMANSF